MSVETIKVKVIDFSILAARKLKNIVMSIAANEDNIEQREVTGEDILALCEASGGTAVVERDEHGLICSIQASIPAPTSEYESDEMSEVLESLQATGVTPSKIVGDLAQTSVGQSLSITGTLTSASPIITSPSSTTGIAIGNAVSGTGIPAGTTIITLSPLTMSANATAAGSAVAIAVSGETQVLGLAEWTIDWKRKTVDATTTDDDTYESSLASTASWTVKSKYMFIDGDSSQATYILATIATPQGAQVWNFFPTIAVGRAGFQGKAYVDGITMASGMGKVVGLDCSLKGTGPLTQLVQTAPIAQPNTVTGQQAEE